MFSTKHLPRKMVAALFSTEALLKRMSKSLQPNVVSFNSTTSSAMSASAWQMALLLWFQMPKQMIQPDTCQKL